MKIRENVFFKHTKTHIASLPSPSDNLSGINNRYGKGNIGERSNNEVYDEVKTGLENEDWSTLNFMQRLGEEKTNKETFSINEPGKPEIAGDENADNNALNTSGRNTGNTVDGNMNEHGISTEKL